MFSCTLCSKHFVTRGCLTSHTQTHTQEKPHKCLICSASFARGNSLKTHLKCIHDGHKVIRKKNFHCSLCSFKFCSKTSLEIHLLKHSTQLSFSCNVPSCGFQTKYEKSLKNHVRHIHSVERPYKCPSDGCSYKSKTRGELQGHLKIHSSDKPFTCKFPGCNYACKMKSYLTVHTSRAHSDEKPFKCSFCDFQGKTRPDLNQHQAKHLKIKSFQCQVPNCRFASCRKKTLALHLDSKHRKKDILCTEPRCNFRCASSALLKRHLKRHRDPILKCPSDSCNFTTRFKHNLRNHISRCQRDAKSAPVTGPIILDLATIGTADAMDTLLCRFPDCGYQTKFQHHLDRHRITHNKEEKREHVCAFCFTRFARLSLLQEHVQRHIGEKRFSCSYCKYAAVSSLALRNHSRAIHQIQVVPLRKEDEMRKCCTCNMSFSSYTEFVLHSMNHLQSIVVLERLRIIVT